MGQYTRRRLLQLAGGGLALVATRQSHPHSATASARGPSVIPKNARLTPSGNRQSVSRLIDQNSFTTLFVSWRGDRDSTPDVEISVQSISGVWSGWIPLRQDHHVPESSEYAVHFHPLIRTGQAFDIRSSRPELADQLTVVGYNALANAGESLQGSPEEEPIELIDGFIIPRAGWGADESYRYIGQDVSNPVAWPPSYQEIEKVVVHHTATEFGWDDPAVVVRSIYTYHAVVLNWSDIGYNFLIDAYGNVYEGRFGGPGVVGGHAFEYNSGSLGVALIGSYGNSMPSEPARAALTRLIRSRAPDVDPTVAADWIDWADVPNICGHGDVINTDCPGSDLQSVLPDVRGRLAGTPPLSFPPPIRLYDPKILTFEAGPSLIDPDGLVEIRATVTQAGREPLLTQGPDIGFTYDEGQDFDNAGYQKVEGRFRLAVDVVGADGVPNPYRWGFGDTIVQGEEREIVGYIRMHDMGTKQLVPSIVREYVRYYEEDDHTDAVHVVHKLVSRAPRSLDDDYEYIQETGHNVPEVFYSYWSIKGALQQFGFPLTEPFIEQSQTDGHRYLTQYFERARFEYHPELAENNDVVKLGLLGIESTKMRANEPAFKPVKPVPTTSEFMYFPETRHSTSYRFLETWLQNGAVASFGYPVSEKFEEYSLTDGKLRLVQYFERVRFEYHPDEPWEKQIKLGHLGREMLIERGWLPGPGVAD